MTKETVASLIDHTMLMPNAGMKDILRLCQEAARCRFASVCVNPVYVAAAARELAGSGVKVCSVVGFPFGAVTTQDKACEACGAVVNGADEIDMVMDIGAAADRRFADVEADVAGVVSAVRGAGDRAGRRIVVKVILETCFFDDDTIRTCCGCAVRGGADFVKTSTGFASPKSLEGSLLPNGASVHHVALMRSAVGADIGVKASGGIRSARTAVDMLSAGASRIGTSSGVQILSAWDESVRIRGFDD